MSAIKEILIIRLSSIGDILHCTPVASSLKAAWPDCRITWLVGEVSAELLHHNPAIDELIIWSRERFERNLKNYNLKAALTMWLDLKKQLAARTFYAVLDIHGLFLTGMIATLAKTSRRIGLSGTRELNSLFMTKTAKPLGKHIIDRYLGVLPPLGITTFQRRMTLILPEKARRFAAGLLSGNPASARKKLAVFVPGTTWPAKNWPPDYFAQTAKSLAGDFRIILCGGQAELRLGLELQAKAGFHLLNAINKTSLLEMAAIIEKAAVVISGDTGPLYIAAALGTPAIAIFGPTDPAIYAPPGEKTSVLSGSHPCAFCHRTTCPKGAADCMRDVTPAQVVRQIYRLVEKPPAGYRRPGTFSGRRER